MRSKTSKWFETKIRYEQMTDDGLYKFVTEKYTVDALSHTEAEERIVNEMSSLISGEIQVKGIVPASYGEVFFCDNEDADKWYKAKLCFMTYDESTNREKRSNIMYLVQAKSFKGAVSNIMAAMDDTMLDYDIVSVTETPIVDVYEYKVKTDKSDEVDGKSKAAGE